MASPRSTLRANNTNFVAEDRALVLRCLSGDEGAWDDLYQRCHGPLVTAIKAHLGARSGDRELVDEIAARVWYHVLQNDGAALAGFDPSRNCRLTTYLAIIARNQIRTFMRGESRRRVRETIAARGEHHAHDPAKGLDGVEFDELRETLTRGERDFLLWCTHPERLNGRGKKFEASAAQWRYRVRSKIRDFLARE